MRKESENSFSSSPNNLGSSLKIIFGKFFFLPPFKRENKFFFLKEVKRKKMIKKHYAKFFYSGALDIETFSQEISSRNLKEVKVPDEAFGFEFFDVVFDEVEVGGEKIELSSKRLNVSPMYYYGGRIYTKAEVEFMIPCNERLLQSMRENNWEKVIQTRMGNFRPFEEKNIFIEEK